MAASTPRMPGQSATPGRMSSLPARRFSASQTMRRRFAPCVADRLGIKAEKGSLYGATACTTGPLGSGVPGRHGVVLPIQQHALLRPVARQLPDWRAPRLAGGPTRLGRGLARLVDEPAQLAGGLARLVGEPAQLAGGPARL